MGDAGLGYVTPSRYGYSLAFPHAHSCKFHKLNVSKGQPFGLATRMLHLRPPLLYRQLWLWCLFHQGHHPRCPLMGGTFRNPNHVLPTAGKKIRDPGEVDP
jgi:hypothetical protein